MPIEVELKFPLGTDTPTPDQMAEQLVTLGGVAKPVRKQDDHYYAHPVRDFAETDEALRIRADNGAARLTFKGPRLDEVAKTRQESETEVGSAEVAAEILLALGFSPVRIVSKLRRPFELQWNGLEVEAVIDDVVGLGVFVELEAMHDGDDHERIRDQLLSLADTLGLRHSERRSYLCLLLAQPST